MSRVFLVEDLELEHQIVVKVLPPELAAGLSVDRFRREIHLAKPHQISVGVDRVFVNGVEIVRDGRHTGATPGRVLRGAGATPR